MSIKYSTTCAEVHIVYSCGMCSGYFIYKVSLYKINQKLSYDRFIAWPITWFISAFQHMLIRIHLTFKLVSYRFHYIKLFTELYGMITWTNWLAGSTHAHHCEMQTLMTQAFVQILKIILHMTCIYVLSCIV